MQNQILIIGVKSFAINILMGYFDGLFFYQLTRDHVCGCVTVFVSSVSVDREARAPACVAERETKRK